MSRYRPWAVVRARLHYDVSGYTWPLMRLPDGTWTNTLTGARFRRDQFDVLERLRPKKEPH